MKATYLKGRVLKKVEMLLMKHFDGDGLHRAKEDDLGVTYFKGKVLKKVE